MKTLHVPGVMGMHSEKELVAAMLLQNQTPVHTVGLLYGNVKPGDKFSMPIDLRITFFGGSLPLDVLVHYPQRILSQPEGPSAEERFPEMNTLLPIIGTLQQLHLEMMVSPYNHSGHLLQPVVLQRFPYPSYIQYKDTQNYALVLTRFCVGMLIPFAFFVAMLSEEKVTGMKEMLRLVGIGDWVYWSSHYLSAAFFHVIIATLMMLFVCVKRNEEGRSFIQYSDPMIVFFILLCFGSSCTMHATLLSMFFKSPHSAVAGAMVYWTFSCVMPFLLLENDGGQGYHFIRRRHKLATCVFPGMSLHWSFRVLERFEKFVTFGANWSNFYDRNATPDNVTLAEIVFIGLICDCFIVAAVWYLDNVVPVGPGIAKPFYYPFQMSYWVPAIISITPPAMTTVEMLNFQEDPKGLPVAIDIVKVSKDYDELIAIQDVTLKIFENQVTVLLGHNGAGKTTLLNMVTGFTKCSSGNIVVGGFDITTCTKDARESFGYCPQNNILFNDLTVEEHLIFFAAVKGTPYQHVRLEVVTLLHDLDLMPYRSELAVNLSLGLQRRLCIAVAIVSKPKVVILDEPTANMDPEGRREMWELLLKIRRNCSVFLTTQHLDEADVLGDRIIILASGHVRCAGSPAFLKHRFGTGYHIIINKGPEVCDITSIETLLRKYAPKAKLESDSPNEAVFILGQIVSTRLTVTMFKDLEQRSKELGIDTIGVRVTSLEDVLVQVGEEHHDARQFEIGEQHGSMFAIKDDLVKVMATTVSENPGLLTQMWAVLAKRATCIWREKKQSLLSWLLPPLLLTVLFQFEYMALRRSNWDVERVSDTLAFTFPDVVHYAQGYVQIKHPKDGKFFYDYILPQLSASSYFLQTVDPDMDVTEKALSISKWNLRYYIFGVHYGFQFLDENSTILWYNGDIPHCALIITTMYNMARLKYLTGIHDAVIRFQVKQLDYGSKVAEDENVKSQNTYRDLLPKVLRSIFLPLASSLMCSNFVLLPIAERVQEVKHLHSIAGIGSFLYWTLSFISDFMFYMGTAIFVLPPIIYYQAKTLNYSFVQWIFCLNILHGFAALPFIYLFSLLFSQPGVGFSKMAISTFIISLLGCMASVFMEHYALTLDSFPLTVVIEVVLQVLRLLPSFSYSRGMTKLLQLASENFICRIGGQVLEAACFAKTAESKLSLKQCCAHMDDPDPEQYAIAPLDMHPYSVFYEILTLVIEGPVLFIFLLFLDGSWLSRLDQRLSEAAPEQRLRLEVQPGAQGLAANVGGRKAAKREDTDVYKEDKLVTGILYQRLPPPQGVSPAMIVCRLEKAYGYVDTNVVLKFRRYLGYCPQRDGLLDLLTGVETLILYTRLRGIPLTQEYLNTLLSIFHLEDIADQLVARYSAGNRRKLSMCISMIGMPNVLLLDEPYAGVGTTSRKRIVNYLSALQRVAKMSIVLTSHSLADVEFLCNRIAILGKGKLQCLGSVAHLKDKFGKGYTITVKTYPDKKEDILYHQDVAHAVLKNFRDAELVHSFEGLLEFRMSRIQMLWSEMFTRMSRIKKRFKLQDFFITDTSLEQIFLSVTRKEASEAAAKEAAKAIEPTANPLATTIGIL
ncbi:phospholipid-transporting ATPase ABCA3-like isoform X2 [Dermacentor variabilis]|uniref:phospholipid-transporting ATPase ABCA3-like isoform X2 n=1 Tax=Dermacentor variabilis TaxID=34621 RepID=UPI003F5B3BD3